VIKGGFDPAKTPEKRRFLTAEVTDTRLMGVVALAVAWEVTPAGGADDEPYRFHQFFYYDAEEYGLETYRSLRGDDVQELTILRQSLMGGLGGKYVKLTEKEVYALVQQFAAGSRELGVPIAEPRAEYAFLLDTPVQLSMAEEEALWNKLCTPLRSDYHLVHYFLMRIAGHDFGAAARLLSDGKGTDAAGNPVKKSPLSKAVLPFLSGELPSTLCKNTIEEFVDRDGTRSYLCEALLEDKNGYRLAVMEVITSGACPDPAAPAENGAALQVVDARLNSCFRITPEEAAMQLNRDEYVTSFDILLDPEPFEQSFSLFTLGCMRTDHDMGRLFLEFNKTNDHVNQRVFRLNEDVHGLYYVSDFGQLIVAAYTPQDIVDLENKLFRSALAPFLHLSGKFLFKEQVIYEFIQSGMDDFLAFVATLQED